MRRLLVFFEKNFFVISFPLIFFLLNQKAFNLFLILKDKKDWALGDDFQSLIINPHLSVNCVGVLFPQLVAIVQNLDSASLKVFLRKNWKALRIP